MPPAQPFDVVVCAALPMWLALSAFVTVVSCAGVVNVVGVFLVPGGVGTPGWSTSTLTRVRSDHFAAAWWPEPQPARLTAHRHSMPRFRAPRRSMGDIVTDCAKI